MTALLSADEYLATGDERPRWTQLINGEVYVNTPNVRHQRLVAALQIRIALWCEAAPGRGECLANVDAKLDSGNVFAPDVFWNSELNKPAVDAKNLEGPPDLVIEVRSPSTWRFDVGVKRETYERAGLKELWLVDTASDSVLVFRRSTPTAPTFDHVHEFAAGTVLETPMMPGLAVDITDLFAR